jgi:hypothetical protein
VLRLHYPTRPERARRLNHWCGKSSQQNSPAKECATIFWHSFATPDDPFTLHQADQAPTDYSLDGHSIHRSLCVPVPTTEHTIGLSEKPHHVESRYP